MKKIISVFLSLTMILCLFSGCDHSKTTKIKIGLAAPAVTHGWVAGVSYYAEKYCKENKIEYNLTTSENAEEMEKNIKQLVDWGAEAVILWPQWTGMEKAVNDLIESGINVISFDVDINANGIYKVTGNNYDMGYQSAKYITEKVGDNAAIAVLDVPMAGSVSNLRKKGFYDYLETINYNTENIFEIEEDGFTFEAGYTSMMNAMKEHKKIDAVFSMDDEMSLGIVKAVTENGRTDIKAITGGGGKQEYFKMIQDENYADLGLASAIYSPSMVKDAIKAAIDLCTGKEVGKIIVMPTKIVDRESVSNYLEPQNNVY